MSRSRPARRTGPEGPVEAHRRGLEHVRRGEYAEAMTAYAAAIQQSPDDAGGYIDLSVACNRTGQFAVALRACELALAIAPGHPLALVNQGMAWKGLRLLEEAKRSFLAAGEHPMARFNLGHTLLLEDDLGRGLPLCEYRRPLLGTGSGLAGEPWNGDARPEATLLVVPEQGLGDFILQSRWFTPLADRFARVVVHTPEPLARLVAGLDPRLEVTTTLSGAHWELWAPIMSLPLLMGVRALEDVPVEPWIRVEGGEPAAERQRLRVGLNWAGNPTYAYDTVRSTSLDAFTPLFAIPDVDWVSLHRGAREAEATTFGLPQPLRDAADFLDTARVLAGLDLVISTETAVPNLSAAMGVQTCVMSAPDVDWRWSGWYRGVTVCAQGEAGDWSVPVAEAAAIVRARATDRLARAAA